MERDYTTGAGTAIVFNFNSHAHVERDNVNKRFSLGGEDFNSHAHVERDDTLIENLPAIIISTHTLTWSVTCRANKANSLANISTHTLTWSVTLIYRRSADDTDNFNSHAHVERDQG